VPPRSRIPAITSFTGALAEGTIGYATGPVDNCGNSAHNDYAKKLLKIWGTRAMARKALLVGSSGGHLLQLLRAKEALTDWELVWVCFRKPDAQYFLEGYRTYWCRYPTTRNYRNLILNTIQAVKVLWTERPDVILSSGAGVAIPYFYIGKALRKRTVYIESFTRVESKSLTGRVVYPVTDLFCVQWESMLKYYPKAKMIGRLP